MSSISGVSGQSNAWADISTQRSRMQAKMFAKVDTDGSGGIDQSELSTMLSDISQKTGVSLDAQKPFTSMDSNSDGSVDSTEMPAFTDKMKSETGVDSTTSFSSLDTNQDGTVSELERLAGALKSFVDSSDSSSSSSKTSDSLLALAKLMNQQISSVGRPRPAAAR